jgi:hypothetical protein
MKVSQWSKTESPEGRCRTNSWNCVCIGCATDNEHCPTIFMYLFQMYQLRSHLFPWRLKQKQFWKSSVFVRKNYAIDNMRGFKNNCKTPPSLQNMYKSICGRICSPMHRRVLEGVAYENELLYCGIIFILFPFALSPPHPFSVSRHFKNIFSYDSFKNV